MGLPPGVEHLARTLPTFLLPSAVAYATLRTLRHYDVWDSPTWIAFSAVILAKPVQLIFNNYFKRYVAYQDAKRIGARIVPTVEEKPYLGGISILRRFIKMVNSGYIADAFYEWIDKYGNTLQVRLPTSSQIYTFEPDHIKAVLATQFEDFEKGPNFIAQMNSLLGTGVFNSDGEMWKFHRTLTRPFFKRERISDFDIFDVHADTTLTLAKQRFSEGYPIDFQDLVARFTLDTAGRFLFGHDLHSLSGGLPYPSTSGRQNPEISKEHPSNVFVDTFFHALNQITFRIIMGTDWPWFEFLADRVKPMRETLDRFIEPMLVKALGQKRSEQSPAKDGESDAEGATLLEHLVAHTQDVTILKDELINLLVAGRDTTASLLTFAVYMLAEYPHIARRIREEIIEKVGESQRPTYDNIRDMKYLRAFINEVLRLYPPVPFDSRTSNKATTLNSKDGKLFYVPKDTLVAYSVFVMQRRTDLWGPDALEFDPDRFLDERLHKYLIPDPFIFCPFNAGPRICLGQQFAYHEASFFLIRLLQQFSSFHLALDAQPADSIPPVSWAECGGRKATEKIMPGANLTMYIKGGLWVRME